MLKSRQSKKTAITICKIETEHDKDVFISVTISFDWIPIGG